MQLTSVLFTLIFCFTLAVSCLVVQLETSNTQTDADALLQELKIVRRQGYAVDNEEFINGMLAAAVPILDKRGKFIAALAFHAPLLRMDKTSVEAQTGLLKQTAVALADLFDLSATSAL